VQLAKLHGKCVQAEADAPMDKAGVTVQRHTVAVMSHSHGRQRVEHYLATHGPIEDPSTTKPPRAGLNAEVCL